MKNALIYLIVFVAIQVGVATGVAGLWRLLCPGTEVTLNATMQVVILAVYSAITLAVFLLARWTTVSRRYLRSQPWVVLFWCAFAAIGMIVPSLWAQELMPKLPDTVGENLQAIVNNEYGYFVIALFAPVVEEVVFRGAILRSLLGWTERHWVAIALSALFFALIHFNPAQMPHAFVGGLLLGWLYYRTGSIIPGIAYHWVNNTVAFVMARIVPDPDAQLVTLFGSDARVLMAVGFSLLILLPSLYQLHLRMKRVS